jgi:hypothetical protein
MDYRRIKYACAGICDEARDFVLAILCGFSFIAIGIVVVFSTIAAMGFINYFIICYIFNLCEHENIISPILFALAFLIEIGAAMIIINACDIFHQRYNEYEEIKN